VPLSIGMFVNAVLSLMHSARDRISLMSLAAAMTGSLLTGIVVDMIIFVTGAYSYLSAAGLGYEISIEPLQFLLMHAIMTVVGTAAGLIYRKIREVLP